MGRTVIHHTDVEIFSDVSVEVHHFPSYTFNPFRWKKYRKWFEEQAACQMQLMDRNVGFVYPSIGFNVVYSLMHIYRHVFHEGIGLRQLMDYYFILQHTFPTDRSEAMRTLRWFGLERFAAAVMYVLGECYGLDKERMLCEPEAEAGRFILDEILKYGNFGKYNENILKAHAKGGLSLYLHNVSRLSMMLRYHPLEVLWAPFWKVGHYVWRKVNGYS